MAAHYICIFGLKLLRTGHNTDRSCHNFESLSIAQIFCLPRTHLISATAGERSIFSIVVEMRFELDIDLLANFI